MIKKRIKKEFYNIKIAILTLLIILIIGVGYAFTLNLQVNELKNITKQPKEILSLTLYDFSKKMAENSINMIKGNLNLMFDSSPGLGDKILVTNNKGQYSFFNRDNYHFEYNENDEKEKVSGSVFFDETTMNIKRKNFTNPKIRVFEITDKKGRIILEKGSLEYSKKTIREIFERTAKNVKIIGFKSDFHFYNPDSLELLADATGDCYANDAIMAANGRVYLDLIGKYHSDLKTKNQRFFFNYIIDNQYSTLIESSATDRLLLNYYESEIPEINFNEDGEIENKKIIFDTLNMFKYPFGDYEREIQSKRLFKDPSTGFTTINVGGLTIKPIIGIAGGVNEQELNSYFTNYKEAYSLLEKKQRALLPLLFETINYILILSTVFVFLNIIIFLYSKTIIIKQLIIEEEGKTFS